MRTYYPYSINDFGSVSDCKMILRELKDDMRELPLTPEQYAEVLEILNQKILEVEERYKNK